MWYKMKFPSYYQALDLGQQLGSSEHYLQVMAAGPQIKTSSSLTKPFKAKLKTIAKVGLPPELTELGGFYSHVFSFN